MKNSRWMIALTVVNLAVLLFTFARHGSPTDAQDSAGVVRARVLQIVDDQGRVRASISVQPAGRSAAGDAYPETVLFRLITERGRPSVKIAATEQTSGMSIAGPTGTRDSYLILQAGRTDSSLRVRNEDGKEQIIKP